MLKYLYSFILLVLYSSSFAQNTVADTTVSDTIKKKNIKPDTHVVLPQSAYRQHFNYKKQTQSLATFHYWNELDTLQGFANHLGLVGKPYRNLRFGVHDRYLGADIWRNPLNGNTNILMPTPNDIRYFDSKTPYVNVNFAQGPQKKVDETTMLDFTFSQNIRPFWNMTAFYKRKQASSRYAGNLSDMRQMYISTNLHDYKNRFQLFGYALYNSFDNFYHGGVFREVGSAEEDAFLGQGAAMNLSNTVGKMIVKNLYADGYYHLLRFKDSAKTSQLLVFRGTFSHEYVYQRLVAKSLSKTALQENWVPVLPTLRDTAESMFEENEHFQYRAAADARYGLKVQNVFHFEANGGIAYELNRNVRKDSSYNIYQNVFEQSVHTFLEVPKILNLTHQLDFRTRPNNLFNPETFFQNRFAIALPIKKKDSLSVQQIPIRISFTQLLHSQNPSLFQQYYKAESGSNFYVPNKNLNNLQVNHLRGKIEWELAAKVRDVKGKKDTLLANYIYFQPFLTQLFQYIYYDDSLHVKQAGSGQYLSYIGAEAGGRLRFMRKFYVEAKATLQQGTATAAPDTFFKMYAQHLPNFYGKVGVFYENTRLRYKGVLRIGIDAWLATTYMGDTFDPASGEFFPSATVYYVPTYPRIDVYFATQIKRAYLYAKVMNLTDGLLVPGSYTIPFYPTMPRMLSLGVNWTFFD